MAALFNNPEDQAMAMGAAWARLRSQVDWRTDGLWRAPVIMTPPTTIQEGPPTTEPSLYWEFRAERGRYTTVFGRLSGEIEWHFVSEYPAESADDSAGRKASPKPTQEP